MINASGRLDKFLVDDLLGKSIIKKNKDRIRPLANATSDEFLGETIALNIISLAKTREIMARESDVTNHGNPYLAVNNTVEVLKLVQLPVKIDVFEEQLSQICEKEISDLFAHRTAKIETGILLHKYQMFTKEN